ncbi:putative 2,4-dienoyl-CoA reductase [Anoxybacillus sp. BCO1]|nr:putative 2,4-dienoyl-CoA reductase [Anoxybacillus sp. BCO1]
MDVRQPELVAAMVKETDERFGKIDALINNAAGNFICPAEKLSINGWNSVIDIVLNGTFYCSREVGNYWIEKEQKGSIINIVATYAWGAGAGVIHSACAKAGVLTMTRTLAVEWGKNTAFASTPSLPVRLSEQVEQKSLFYQRRWKSV